MQDLPSRLGLIAGGGEFPFLVADECRRLGIEVVAAAVRDETEEGLAARVAKSQWLGVGQLGKLIRYFKQERVEAALMAGKVRHVRIFGRDHPDLRMLGLLARLPARNTDNLLGGIADELEREGIRLLDSTRILRRMVPGAGILTRRLPDRREKLDMEFGLRIAREIARLDIGQTIVVRDQAVVAVEAMEGTDQAIERAAGLGNGKKLTVIKVSKPDQDMRFDVPVIGPQTIEVLSRCRVSALALDADRSLIFHIEDVIQAANQAGLVLVAVPPAALTIPANRAPDITFCATAT